MSLAGRLIAPKLKSLGPGVNDKAGGQPTRRVDSEIQTWIIASDCGLRERQSGQNVLGRRRTGVNTK